MEKNHQSYENNEQRDKAERIGYEALSEIATKYGSGYQIDGTPEVEDKPYHNLQHSWRVKTVAEKIARKLGMSEYDIALTGMIAASHDVIHEKVGDLTAEHASADWLVARMQAEGFGEDDQVVARLAIHGTSTHMDAEGNFVGQQFAYTEYPDERAGTIALCVASADMEAAYTNYGPAVIHDYFKELNGYGSFDTPPTLDGLIEFQEMQVSFLGNLQPLFTGAEQVLGNLKQEGIKHHAMLLERLRTGEITAWDQVVALDNEFAYRYQPSLSR
jgi:hypothetical protein